MGDDGSYAATTGGDVSDSKAKRQTTDTTVAAIRMADASDRGLSMVIDDQSGLCERFDAVVSAAPTLDVSSSAG
jgi:hypothetical protein